MEIEICDYHEDKVVNGVLCYLQDGEWIEYTKRELTDMFLCEQDAFDDYINRIIEGGDVIACGGELL